MAEFQIASDPADTAKRQQAFRAYVESTLLDPAGRFLCPHYQDCRAAHARKYPGAPFYEGQMGGVEEHYSLSINGRPFRILIVGQERGSGPSRLPPSFNHSWASTTGLTARWGTHWSGTAHVLKILLGVPPDHDPRTAMVTINGVRASIFTCFAYTRLILCTPSPRQGTTKSGAVGSVWKTMWRNCAPQLLETIKILEPAIIVIQKAIRQEFMDILRAQFVARAHGLPLYQWRNGRGSPLVAVFVHPSTPRGVHAWHAPSLPYFRETVIPTIAAAHQYLGIQ